jgi:SAM-dependent methyltransferase
LGRARNFLKLRAIRSVLDRCGSLQRVLDVPCGAGRFTARLPGRITVGLDVSLAMLGEARQPAHRPVVWIQGDIENLPFHSGSFDCVVTIRFLRHLSRAERVKILEGLRDASRRWVVCDFIHRGSWKALMEQVRSSLGARVKMRERLSEAEVAEELRVVGLRPVAMVPCLRFWSEKWVVLAERVEA